MKFSTPYGRSIDKYIQGSDKLSIRTIHMHGQEVGWVKSLGNFCDQKNKINKDVIDNNSPSVAQAVNDLR
ncbi:hypothetical protein YC2023_084546 [Brassica napus]